MRTLAGLGFVLVVTSANAQTTTTVDRETHPVTTKSPEHPPSSSEMEAAHSTARANSVTTVAHPGESDQPKDDVGDKGAAPR